MENYIICNCKRVSYADVENALKNHEYEELEIKEYAEKTRAFVKIEDGCNEFCTYCIIPFARGAVRSRKIENIIKEVEFLAEKGFCEVVLTGIHLASYGKDLKDTNLADVISAVAKVDGIERIRLGSLEPRVLTEDFIKKIAASKKVCNHFHISLQSGCDETLKRMNRKYTAAGTACIRTIKPVPILSTILPLCCAIIVPSGKPIISATSSASTPNLRLNGIFGASTSVTGT